MIEVVVDTEIYHPLNITRTLNNFLPDRFPEIFIGINKEQLMSYNSFVQDIFSSRHQTKNYMSAN